MICRNCGENIARNSKFCPFCKKATKSVKESIGVSMREVMLVYGPPYSYKHHCEHCGKDYLEKGLGSKHALVCPFCGKDYGDEPEESPERSEILEELKKEFEEFRKKN